MSQIKAAETAAVIARELAEQTKRNLQAGDITYTVKAMVQLVDLLDVQLRNLTPGGKDSAARSLNKVGETLRKYQNLASFFLGKINPTIAKRLNQHDLPELRPCAPHLSTAAQIDLRTPNQVFSESFYATVFFHSRLLKNVFEFPKWRPYLPQDSRPVKPEQ